ncbi:MAG: alpha-2-macroglobulin family protein, partial [Candidatus Zipacnadales bacterium]
NLTGSIWVSAYRIQSSGNIIRDTAPMFVEPASDLSIEIQADAETYRPGETATVNFAVRDAQGNPVAAALGLNVVDESVFALQELKPGMEKVYFYLEQELMKPRFEIHEFDMPAIIAEEPSQRPIDLRREKAARVLMAGAEMPDADRYYTNTYADRVNKLKKEWAQELIPKLQKIQRAIQQYAQQHEGRTYKERLGAKPLLETKLLTAEDFQDQWGQPFIILPQGGGEQEVWMFVLQVIGPDGKADTVDDLFLSTAWPAIWGNDRDFLATNVPVPRRFDEMLMFRAGMGGMPGVVVESRPAPAAFAMAEEKGAAPPVADGAGKPVRVRKYFPETMFSEPALITNENGQAKLSLTMADSITTWRMTALANSKSGQLGSTTSGLRCFQDFFVDIDLPVSLTRNDQVSIPVMVFNHLDESQNVRLELTEADWFTLEGDAKRTLEIGAKDEAAIYFTITAKEIGEHPLIVHAYGSKLSDAIERRIEIRPDGQETLTTINGRLDRDLTQTISLPREAIDGASDIIVKIYSGIFSQAVEGLDAILQMPFGCFEQTSSATYPNVLVLDYMKTTGQVTPEIRMKAEGFINTGYQRLVAYEVPGGGFSWFGEPPANKILTAYGLMEFADMSRVYEVDAAVIQRTAEWLFAQQEGDGSWKPDETYLHQESWGRIQNSSLLPTAYLAWALGRTGSEDARLKKAVSYIKQHAKQAKDAYTLALICNALVANTPNDAATQEQLGPLIAMAKRQDEKMWWESEITGLTHSSGKSSDLEATGLAAWALIHSGTHPTEATEVLNYLIAEKDPNGTWYSTQATVLALSALLDAQKGSTQKVNAEISILCNGELVRGLAIDEHNADVVHFVSLKPHVREGDNEVKIKFAGEGTSLYQITSKYFLPWKAEAVGQEAVAIDVQYDKTELAVEDMVTAHVTITNNTPGRMGMVLVDLGIPPGFEVQSGDLAELVDSKIIQKYTLTGRQIIIYLEELKAGQKVELQYRLKAKFPIKAKTPDSTVYEYYNPDNRGIAAPIELVVSAR